MNYSEDITHLEKIGLVTEVTFSSGEWVLINRESCLWEYLHNDIEDSYCCGSYTLEGNTVCDYDGVFQLPKAVIKALSFYYDMDEFIDDNEVHS